MAGSAGTENYNEAGNSDFSRKAMELAEAMLAGQWEAPSVAVTDGTRMTRGGARSDELLLTGQAMKASDQWAAPQARDHFPAHSDSYIAAKKAQGHGMRNLNDEAANWTHESLTWPAPAARDHKGSSASSIVRQDGKVRNDMLDYAAEQFFHPPSSPDQPIAGGSTCSTDGPNSNQPSAKRKLNPIFVEALMRWPTGLSGFERQEMAWTRWWQLMPSFVSALVSQRPEPKQGSLF
jgi:hypothetical protein